MSSKDELRREIINADGELIADEYITENHGIMMYQPFIGEESSTAENKKTTCNVLMTNGT